MMEPDSDAGATDVSSATPFLSFSCSINRRSSSLLLEKDKDFLFKTKNTFLPVLKELLFKIHTLFRIALNFYM